MHAFLALFIITTSTSLFAGIVSPFLIRGIELEPTELKEVVRIKAGTSACTATIVGPKVVLTAAHCVRDSSTAVFKYGGKRYTAEFEISPYYEDSQSDLALGITDEVIKGASPLSIGDDPEDDERVLLAGYGCTNSDRTGGNDGILRANWADFVGHRGNLLWFEDSKGGAGCSGDSGGPALRYYGKKLTVAGVHSKADLSKRTLSTSLTDSDSRSFLDDFTQQNLVTICGWNRVCSSHGLPTGL